MTDFVDADMFSTYMSVNRDDEDDPGDAEWLTLALAAGHNGVRSAIKRDLTVATGTPTTRTFEVAGCGPQLRIDDCVTVTKINGVAFDSSTYLLAPLNNRSASGEWRPYTTIRARRGWQWYGSINFGTVDIEADWGWLATGIPPQAYTGVLALSKDIAMNQQIQFGLAAISQYAGIRARENPEVWRQIKDLARAEKILIG